MFRARTLVAKAIGWVAAVTVIAVPGLDVAWSDPPPCPEGGCFSPSLFPPIPGDIGNLRDREPKNDNSHGSEFAAAVLEGKIFRLPPNSSSITAPSVDSFTTVSAGFNPDSFDTNQLAIDLGASVAAQLTVSIAGSLRLPVKTGVPATHDALGRERPADTLDPVEPISGEFVIEEVDLELPSFGLPFRLTRVYRSRIDFSGPLGPAWDHGLNQRLANVPSISFNGVPGDGGYDDLHEAQVPPTQAALDPTAGCGPVLGLSTGSGSTIQFREIIRTSDTINYRSDASHLSLEGAISATETTWKLRTPTGDVRHFDRFGRLVRWVDSHGLGLTLAWSSGDDTTLESVTDAEGRTVSFEYDVEGLLARVVEETSELEATYLYEDGVLATARKSDGRTESYQYDIDGTRQHGDWVAEGQLRQACEAACKTSDSTCTSGGACDDAVGDAMAACLGSCQPCAQTCRAACPARCGAACEAEASPYCETQCNNKISELRDYCEEEYEDLEPKALPPSDVAAVPAYCFGCIQACEAAYEASDCEVYPLIRVPSDDH